MACKLSEKLLIETGLTKEQLIQLPSNIRLELVKQFKNELTSYKRNKETSIRNHYETIKRQEILQIRGECNEAENRLISLLDIGIVKKKKIISKGMREAAWRKKYGNTKLRATCNVCSARVIERDNFECGHIIAESKGGSSELCNLIPICEKCNKHMGIENMVAYKNKISQVTNWEKVFNDMVSTYFIFKLNPVDNTPLFPKIVSEIEEYMYICASQFEILNKTLQFILNMDVLENSKIICQKGQIILTQYTGKPVDDCYYINVPLLWQYIMLVILEELPDQMLEPPHMLQKIDLNSLNTFIPNNNFNVSELSIPPRPRI